LVAVMRNRIPALEGAMLIVIFPGDWPAIDASNPNWSDPAPS